MYYGYECKNPENNWQGSAGCWGVLAFGAKHPQVEAINFCMSDSYTSGSLVDCLAQELRKEDPAMTLTESKGQAMRTLCEVVLRNRVQWKLEHRIDEKRGSNLPRWWLRVEGISEMPRNHVMFLLFSLRSSLTGGAKYIWEALRKRGIKSTRKMVLGCQLIIQSSGMQGLNYLQPVGTGGRIFFSEYTVAADVVTMYRGTKLKGPADKPWSAGGGYTSGESARCVQYSGCSQMIPTDKHKGARGNQIMKAGQAKHSMINILGMRSGANYEINAIFDRLAAFLKTLK